MQHEIAQSCDRYRQAPVENCVSLLGSMWPVEQVYNPVRNFDATSKGR